VGWVDLCAPDVTTRLEGLKAHAQLKGIRVKPSIRLEGLQVLTALLDWQSQRRRWKEMHGTRK
jgi:hypothetical protein